MKARSLFLESIKDSLGEVSSKRITLFTIVIVLCTGFILSFFSTKTPPVSIIEALAWIAMACIGGSSAEKFAKSKTPSHETP